jgi:hypothetical protein
MKNDLISELKLTKAELLETLDQFSDQDINKVPFEGSWTAGQVAEHVLRSISAVAAALNGPTKPADRNPEQHIQLFSQVFLDFGHKLNSPDFILPSNEPKNRQSLMRDLGGKLNEIEQAITKSNLDAIRTAFEMPTIGTLSGKELAWFTIVHTKRHIHQLKNIAAELNKEPINN